MQCIVKLKLHPSAFQDQMLRATLSHFTEAFNHICAYGWAHAEKHGVRLDHATYYAVKAAFARRKTGRAVSCPQSTCCPARDNVHT